MGKGAGSTRAGARLAGRRRAAEVAAELGRKIRAARGRRGWTQAALASRVGLTAARIGQIESGQAGGAGLEVWLAIAEALQVPLRIELARDARADVADAGHLAMQELALRLGRLTGRARTFELATKPLVSGHSIDVCLRDDLQRVLIINECWNTFGNVNASVRSTRRKIAEAEQLAAAIGGDAGPYRVAAVWLVRDTRANRELIGRYPEVFATAFTGPSMSWVAALTRPGVPPPAELGLVWSDVRATGLFPWRRSRTG